jgi:hypothetical protein
LKGRGNETPALARPIEHFCFEMRAGIAHQICHSELLLARDPLFDFAELTQELKEKSAMHAE